MAVREGGRGAWGGSRGGRALAAQLGLREDGQAAQVADDAQALRQLHRAAQALEQRVQQRRARALHLGHQPAHDLGGGGGRMLGRTMCG